MPRNQRYQLRYHKRWLYHGIASPLIAVITTYLLACCFGNGEWLFWPNLAAIQSGGVWGGLVYLALATMYEATMLIWRQGHRAGRAEGFAERQSAAIKDSRNEGKNTALTVAWRLAGNDDQKNLVRMTASDLDINLPAILGQPHFTARLEVQLPWDNLWRLLADACADLRRRLAADAFDVESDRMLRNAVGVALADFRKRIERIPESNEGSDG